MGALHVLGTVRTLAKLLATNRTHILAWQVGGQNFVANVLLARIFAGLCVGPDCRSYCKTLVISRF